MSGVGKSTLLEELARRGYETVDADDDTWCVWVEGDDPGYLWREDRIAALLAAPRDRPLIVAGTVRNQSSFPFDVTILLSAPLDITLERIATRTNNQYGKSASERAYEIEHHAIVEPQLRAWAQHELDGTREVAQLADEVELLFGRA